MFSIYKSIWSSIIDWLFWMGTPFKFDAGTNITHWPEAFLKQAYDEAYWKHFSPRVLGASVVSSLLILMVLGLYGVPVVILFLFGIIGSMILVLDLAMGACRLFYLRKKKAEVFATTGTDLVTLDQVFDSTWESVKKKHEEERKEYKTRTGREPDIYR